MLAAVAERQVFRVDFDPGGAAHLRQSPGERLFKLPLEEDHFDFLADVFQPQALSLVAVHALEDPVFPALLHDVADFARSQGEHGRADRLRQLPFLVRARLTPIRRSGAALGQDLESTRIAPKNREELLRIRGLLQEDLAEDHHPGLPKLVWMLPVIGLHLLRGDPDVAEQDSVLEFLDQEVLPDLIPEGLVDGLPARAPVAPSQVGQVRLHLVVADADLACLRRLEEEPLLDELIQQPATCLGVLRGGPLLAEARLQIRLEIAVGDLLSVNPHRGGRVPGFPALPRTGGTGQADRDEDRHKDRRGEGAEKAPNHDARIPKVCVQPNAGKTLLRKHLLARILPHQCRAFNSERTRSILSRSLSPAGSRMTPSADMDRPSDRDTKSTIRSGGTGVSGENRTITRPRE